MKQFVSQIQSCKSVAIDFVKLVISWPQDIEPPKPGQFCTLRVSESTDPLLRRPFAFSGYSAQNNTAEMIIQKRGTTTEIIAGLGFGDTVDVIAPLGNGFPEPAEGSQPVLVAGGIGIGPVLFLARHLCENNNPPVFVLGAKNSDSVVFVHFPAVKDLVFTTDDGSMGFHGTTVDYLHSLEDLSEKELFCCGPGPMLKGCVELAEKADILCWTAMEQVMACGVGACMGCAVELKNGGFTRVCTEGPVFEGRSLQWN
ncbi:MAG: dihydroorotate dehydrogenase electron transfer subunit [Spirochaetia bacterium]